MKNIGFVGLGKLGLDCAEVFSEKYTVYGYDTLPKSSDCITITDLKTLVDKCDWIFIAVQTPHEEGYDGSLPSSHLEPKDFSHRYVIESLKQINSLAQKSKNIVLISTVLPGTIRSVFANIINEIHTLIYNPYLIAMGSVKWDMVNPEMVIIGTMNTNNSAKLEELKNIYHPLMKNSPRYVTGTWEEAESIKIFYNTFISAKISLVNMIQDFALRIGNINVDIVTEALASSTMRIMGPKYMTSGMGDAGACHPRDNIALRWLANKYQIGYDLFDTIMYAREIQAKNLSSYIVNISLKNNLPIIIHGKTYKPDVEYCIGSYSVLVGHYIKEFGYKVQYVDPLADDPSDVVSSISKPSVILWAHNREITYNNLELKNNSMYCDIPKGSIIVDPWRKLEKFDEKIDIIHYGNTRYC